MLSTATLILATVVGATGSCEIWEFTADYCPSCRQMDPVVQQAKAAGLPIRQFHLDRDPGPASQLGITRIPAIVVVVDGQPVSKRVGPTSYQELVQLYRQFAPTEPPAGDEVAPAALYVEETRPAVAHPHRGPPAHSNQLAGPGTTNIQQQAIASSVRLKIEDSLGNSYGTGTVIDVHDDEVLVLTCGHIFRDSGGKGRILCDFFAPGAGREVPARLISYDLRRDIGLVSVRPQGTVQAMKVGGNGQRPQAGDPVFSVGCNHGKEPTIIANQVIAVNRYHGPANLVVGGRPVDGRSGGGLFDQQGVLIGVCNAADQEEDEGLYAALGPVHSELERAGLAFIYNGPAVAAIPHRPAAITHPNEVPQPTTLPVANTTLPSASVRGTLDLVPPPVSTPAAVNSAGAASDVDPEVICIVRSSDQRGKSQVFVIDKPSKSLVGQLSQELSRRGPHMPTNLRVTESPAATIRGQHDADAGWQTMSDRPDARPWRR